MKRGYLLYLAILLPSLLIGILIIRGMRMGPHQRALRKLGKSERMYNAARDQLVLGVENPTKAILAFATNPKKDIRAREQALRILQELPRHRQLPDIGAQLVPLLQEKPIRFKVTLLQVLKENESITASTEIATLFRNTNDTALYAPAHRALRAANERLIRHIEKAIRLNDTTVIDSCLALAREIPSGKGLLYTKLARFYKGRGDSANAKRFMQQTGVVDTCWVVGPFENTGSGTIEQPFSPETRRFSDQDTFHIDDKTIAKWMKVSQVDDHGNVNYQNLFSKRCCSVAYLFTYIHVPENRTALLYLTYWEPTAIWLNDTLIHRQVVYRAAIGDDDVVKIQLQKGVNTLMIKSVQDLSSWRVQARITDFYGEAMPDVHLSWSEAKSDTIPGG